jgi:hypothetical protein
MPIYYGCTNLGQYFPRESFIEIDIGDANAAEIIREAVASDRWTRSREAIAHARELVLDRYQLFPFLAEQIGNERREGGEKREITLRPGAMERAPLQKRLARRVRHTFDRRLRVRRLPRDTGSKL